MNEVMGSQLARPWQSWEESDLAQSSHTRAFQFTEGWHCSPEKGSGSTWEWGRELVGANACPQLRA